MKLLMLNYEFPPIGGGGGQAHASLLKEFAGQRDLVVDVLTSAPGLGFSVDVLADNIRIHKVGIRKKHLHFWRRGEVLAWLFKCDRTTANFYERRPTIWSMRFSAFPRAGCVTARWADCLT